MFSKILTNKEMGFEVDGAGEIGWDGNDDIGELRPTPAKTPEELTANLKKLINKIIETNPLLELSTLCDTGTVGGHIHFGLSTTKPNITSMESLSRKLGSFYLPIIMSEDKLNIKTRDKGSYGKLTDYRVEQHGKENPVYTFEFRAPSAEWMTTEKIAKSTLAYLATVYNEIINHPRNVAKGNAVMLKSQSQASALKSLATTDFRVVMKVMNNKLKKLVNSFEFYPQYKEEIDFILSTEKVNKEKERVNFNMAEGWGLTNYKQPNKRQIFSRFVMAKNDKKNLEEISQTIPLFHNPDTNVAEFANHLKLKIAQLNWKMKNHYFLFGLKKGIKNFIIADKNFNFLIGDNQIETDNDRYHIVETLKRMNMKFPFTKTRKENNNTEANKKFLLIGIPYNMRLDLNYRPIMEHIYDIEKKGILAKDITNKPLPNSINNKENEGQNRGKIADIYDHKEIENIDSEEHRTTAAANNLANATIELATETTNN